MSEELGFPSHQVVTVHFAVEFDQKPDREIPAVAYAFSRAGRLLASAPVKNGQFDLALPAKAVSTTRIFIAPAERGGKGEELTLADMDRHNAYQVFWKYDPKARIQSAGPIPHDLWQWWLLCKCRVRGRVVKDGLAGDVPVHTPVSDARVHICEVDSLWLIIKQLPDADMFRLRNDLLALLADPPPPDPFELAPELAPPFPPRPDPVAMVEFIRRGDYKTWLNPQPEPPRPWVRGAWPLSNSQPEPSGKSGITWLNPQPEPPRPWVRGAWPLSNSQPEPSGKSGITWLNPQPEPPRPVSLDLAPEVRLALNANSPSIVRQALIAQKQLLQPLLCHFPWLLPRLLCDEVAVVETDVDGRFEATIWYHCAGDKPDLYFWVEYFLDGSWQTVYKPNKRCHTWWDYTCGSEVIIHITDPRVPACPGSADLPGMQVVISAIGNTVSIHEIGQEVHLAGGWIILSTTGMTGSPNTDIASYLPSTLKPFAGSLELRMDMSRGNFIDAGITHYRWSYRRVRNADLSVTTDDWHPMTHDVFRFYKVQVPDPTASGGFRPVYLADKMGMDPAYPGKNLTRIQPLKTPVGDYEWTPLNEHIDLAWAYFDTGDLVEPGTEGSVPAVPTAGKYELKLELFRIVGGAPQRVNWSHPAGEDAAAIDVFVANNEAPFVPPTGMTVAPASSRHALRESDDPDSDVVGFRMIVHVDNRPCSAAIDDVAVLTSGSADEHGGPCGFLRFPNRDASQVLVGFTARHPGDHADFYFELDKGSAGAVPEACANWDAGAVRWAWAGAGVNGFARDADSHFTKPVQVATLLDSHGTCTEAAFAETTYVAARATDGYQRAYWLDASATPKAFALAPES